MASGNISATEGKTQSTSALLSVGQVAGLLNCSVRHIFRMADGGRMPSPLRLGACVRWPRSSIEGWVEAGCPSCRSQKNATIKAAAHGKA